MVKRWVNVHRIGKALIVFTSNHIVRISTNNISKTGEKRDNIEFIPGITDWLHKNSYQNRAKFKDYRLISYNHTKH